MHQQRFVVVVNQIIITKKKKKNYNNYERNPWLFDLEWLTSIITMKVDVYSFEVVLLEILCGWRHFGSSQLEEAMH